MSRVIDITGERYGRLVVKEFSEIRDRRAFWKCKCDCGGETVSNGKDLRMGKINSCGCARKETCSERMKTVNRKHGMRGTRLYNVWRCMIERTGRPTHKSYRNYGGRGISVCEEWRNDFMAFHDWSIANGYDPNAKFMECTIDRIDNNGNYEPSNCRWVDMKTQCANRRPPRKRKALIQEGE